MFVFKLAKNGTLFGLFCFSLVVAQLGQFSVHKIIEDTHLTLSVILFKVEANNSLIFLPLQTYENFAEFPFLFIFIIP